MAASIFEKMIWLALSVLIAVFVLLRSDVLHFSQFQPVFTLALLLSFIGGAGVTGVLIFRLYKSQATEIRHVVASLAGMLPIALLVFNLQPQLAIFPHIHDISSDLENPPAFLFAGNDRVEGDNPITYDQSNIGHQQQGYPSLTSLVVPQGQGVVTDAVRAVVEELGWAVLGVNESEPWQLEAVARSNLFRFKDDIAIRVTSRLSVDGRETVVAVRSASRVGVGDLGANAKRIGAFYESLVNRLQAR